MFIKRLFMLIFAIQVSWCLTSISASKDRFRQSEAPKFNINLGTTKLDSIQLFRSDFLTGSKEELKDFKVQNSQLTIDEYTLTPGTHFFHLVNTQDPSDNLEWSTLILSDAPFKMIFPISGEITQNLPTLKWTGPDGVQIWRWFISDQPIIYNEASQGYQGQIFRDGWSSSPSLDLNGSSLLQNGNLPFNKGSKYYYAIYPAYGPQENLVDYKRVIINSFQYGVNQSVQDSITWLYPTEGDTLDGTEDKINFLRWSKVENATQYLVRIFQPTSYGNMIFQKPIQDFFSLDTFSQINFHELSFSDSILLSISAFEDDKKIASAEIHVYIDQNTVNLTLNNLPNNSHVKFTSLDFKAPIEFQRIETNTFTVPQGNWNISMDHPEYYPLQIEGSFLSDSIISFELQKYLSQIEGQILDENQLPFPGAQVQFRNKISNQITEVLSGSQGYFKLPINPGAYAYYTINQHGIKSEENDIQISPDEILNLGEVIVRDQFLYWEVYLKNTQGKYLSTISVEVLRLDGSSILQTQTDQYGYLKIPLSPGQYQLVIMSSIYENKVIPIAVPQETIEQITVNNSLFKISGTLLAESWIDIDSVQKRVIPTQPVYTYSASSDTLWSMSDENGKFAFQIPNQESWTVGTYYHQKRTEVNGLSQDLPSKNLIIKNKARIKGVLNSTSPNLTKATAFAFLDQLKIQGSVFQENSKWVYLFEDLDEGDYQIQIATDSLIAKTTTPITVFKNQIINQFLEFTGPTLSFSSSIVNTKINLSYLGGGLDQANLFLQSPVNQAFLVSDTMHLTPATYALAIIPNNLNIIPLDSIKFDRTSTLDTLIYFEFQDSHSPLDEYDFTGNSFTNELEITTSYQNPPDSMWINYRWNSKSWTRQRITTLETTGAKSVIPLPQEGFLDLDYFFEIFRDTLRYTNKTYGKVFHSKVNVSRSNWVLYPNLLDSIKMPTSSKLSYQLKLYDKTGTLQDIDNQSLDRFKLSQQSKSTWKIQIDSLSKELFIESPNKKDTLDLQLSFYWKGDTVLWNKTILAQEILSNEIQLSLSPNKDYYFPGDTIEVNSFLIDQNIPSIKYNSGNTITVNGQKLSSNQYVIPEQYIGPIKFTTQWNQLKTNSEIEVIGIVPVNNSQKIFFRDSTFQLVIQKGANSSVADIPIRLRGDLKDSITWAKEQRNVLEGPFAIHYPFARALDSFPILQYQKPEDIETIYVRSFNDSSYQFIEIDSSNILPAPIWKFPTSTKNTTYGSTTDNFVWTITSKWPIYFDISESKTEALQPFIQITPNPFSPEVIATHDGNNQPGARIDFLPSGGDGSKAVVSINIYNMAGEVVRQLVKREVFPQSPQSIYWDGRTDSGRIARNGRYLVFFESGAINQRSKKSKLMKSVVVFR